MKRTAIFSAMAAVIALLAWWATSTDSPRAPDPSASTDSTSQDFRASAPPPPERANRTQPALSGIVIDTETRQPIPYARVAASGTEAQADGAGRFAFSTLTPGPTALVASASGYAMPHPAQRAPLEIDIVPGVPRGGITLEMWLAASVSGVVVANGRPVEDAMLTAMYEAAPGAPEPFAQQFDLATDTRGRFALETLVPGRLRVLVEHEEHGLAESDELVLAGGASREGLRIELGGRARLAGSVVDEGGRPISGATLQLRAPERRRLESRSVSGGAFSFDGLAAANYVLSVEAPGFARHRIEDLELEPGEERIDFEVRLRAVDGLRGRVVGPSGEPVGKAVVRWSADEGDGYGRALCDAEGRFWIPLEEEEVDPSDRVRLVARHRRFAPSEPVEVSASVRNEVELRLGRGGEITGRVLDAETGEPVQAFRVAVVGYRPFSEGRKQRRGRPHRDSDFHDPEGRYRLEGLAPGTYSLSALARGWTAQRIEDIQVHPGKTTANIEFRLARGASLTGRVVDARTGQPVARASVSIETLYGMGYERGRIKVASDQRGYFRVDDLPEGPRSVTVRHDRYETRIFSGLSVPARGESDVGELALERRAPGEGKKYQYTGIGTVLRRDGDRVFIDNIIDGGAASTFGIEEGTEIVAVDGQIIGSLSLAEVVEAIRGQDGSEVRLTVNSPGTAYPDELVLVRGAVRMNERR